MVKTLSQKIVKNRMDNLDYPIMVCDEVHHVPSETIYMIAMHCNAPVRIGASATPKRTDGADLKIWATCGEIKSTITANELIKRGILAKPEFVFLTPPPVYMREAFTLFRCLFAGYCD